MPTNQTDDDSIETATDEMCRIHEGEYPPELPLGEATVEIQMSEATYQRVCAEYRKHVTAARAHGRAPADFDTYAFNHCRVEWKVTVDGEPVAEPRVDAE